MLNIFSQTKSGGGGGGEDIKTLCNCRLVCSGWNEILLDGSLPIRGLIVIRRGLFKAVFHPSTNSEDKEECGDLTTTQYFFKAKSMSYKGQHERLKISCFLREQGVHDDDEVEALWEWKSFPREYQTHKLLWWEAKNCLVVFHASSLHILNGQTGRRESHHYHRHKGEAIFTDCIVVGGAIYFLEANTGAKTYSGETPVTYRLYKVKFPQKEDPRQVWKRDATLDYPDKGPCYGYDTLGSIPGILVASGGQGGGCVAFNTRNDKMVLDMKLRRSKRTKRFILPAFDKEIVVIRHRTKNSSAPTTYSITLHSLKGKELKSADFTLPLHLADAFPYKGILILQCQSLDSEGSQDTYFCFMTRKLELCPQQIYHPGSWFVRSPNYAPGGSLLFSPSHSGGKTDTKFVLSLEPEDSTAIKQK